MRRYTEFQLIRLGAITVVVMLLIMAAAFNLSKFPGFGGNIYQAHFKDASGIHKGNMVQVAGMRVGRVEDVSLDGEAVLVKFEVDSDVEFGTESRASVEVLNLLGEKYLELTPAGEGQQSEDEPIPVERTQSAYDIVGVFSDLTTTTEEIDKDQLKQALDVVSDTVNASAPEIQASFEGIARLSRTVASRDAEIQALLNSSRNVSALLADRSGDLVDLMANRLSLAPLEDLRDPDRAGAVTITVPGPTGELIDFAVVESPIMEDALQAAHPEIRTYAGSSITEGYAASIRLDMTPFGFHASVRDGQASWYVDPAYLGDTSLYVSYFGASLPTEERLPDEVLDPETGEPLVEGVPHETSDRAAASRVGEGPGGVVIQRIYRLALVNDSAYAEFFAPGKNVNPLDLDASNAAVLAAKTTLMNRVNHIYNDDLAIKMVFVDHTDLLLNLNNDAREAAVGLGGV